MCAVTKEIVLGLNGNEAIAYAVKQAKADVVAAYPITPQTIIVERYSEYVADGEVHTEFVPVESEHSALSACIGASLTGARVFTATAAQGLALMYEMLYIASGLRLPIVMAIVNRALSAPINIHCDHSDTMATRDSCWIQIYCEDAQEAYDSTLQAFRIAEHPDVLLPCMVTIDGFFLSHTLQDVRVLPDDVALKFVGEKRVVPEIDVMGKKYPFRLDPDNPLTFGPLDLYDYYFEHKRQQVEAIENSRKVIREVHDEYAKLTGRRYGDGFIDPYKAEDADAIIICMGSAAGTAKVAIDEIRREGLDVGLIRIRTFRPFPVEEISKALEGKKVVAVMDRCISFGGLGGPVFMEVRAALYDLEKKPLIVNYVYGLGGRDLTTGMVKHVAKELEEIAKQKRIPREKLVRYLGLRE